MIIICQVELVIVYLAKSSLSMHLLLAFIWAMITDVWSS